MGTFAARIHPFVGIEILNFDANTGHPPMITLGYPSMSADPVAEYLDRFRDLFSRADQARWFGVYVRGLLGSTERKSVEPMARSISHSAERIATDPVQALQHFIHASPWDENRLLARYRDIRLKQRLERIGATAIPDTFVLHMVTFLKSGRASVGVLRQAVTGARKKANCQTAVALCHVGPTGHWPLALRLFLPAPWLRDEARVRTAGVPEAFRQPMRKSEIALQLLDAVRADGWPGRYVVADSGIAGPADFRDAIIKRDLILALDAPQEIQPALSQAHASAIAGYARMSEELGLDHFEGRSWRGWHHHASLVLIANGYRPGST